MSGRRVISFLMARIGWTDDEGDIDLKRLDGFVKKQYGIDSHRFLDRKTASKVIEFMKEMDKRPGKGERAQA